MAEPKYTKKELWALVALMPVSMACYGALLVQLWEWFVVPLGIAQISFWHAYGLSTVVKLATWSAADADANAKYRDIPTIVGRCLGLYGGIWAVGAVARYCMVTF